MVLNNGIRRKKQFLYMACALCKRYKFVRTLEVPSSLCGWLVAAGHTNWGPAGIRMACSRTCTAARREPSHARVCLLQSRTRQLQGTTPRESRPQEGAAPGWCGLSEVKFNLEPWLLVYVKPNCGPAPAYSNVHSHPSSSRRQTHPIGNRGTPVCLFSILCL